MLSTDQRLPGVKTPPRQLRLLLVEAGYDPDPTTYEGNKWLKRTSWFAQEPRENSDLMSSLPQNFQVRRRAEVAAAGHISVLSTVRLVGTRQTFEHHQAYGFNQSGGLHACSQQF